MLRVFERASGQQVNIDKSTVFFSKNTCSYLKNDLCNQLGFKEAGDNSIYLGLPSFISRKKSAVFGYVKDRLKERLQGWGKKNLSRAGKEIMLKSSAQTLPNYTMNVFLIPGTICNELERDMCRYWWNSSSSKQKSIHWMSWERMSTRKGVGGMGFRSIKDLNIALLGKQAWRLLVQPTKLVSQVFKSRYYPNDSFLTAKLGSNPSYVWRSVFEAQSLIKQGVSCRVGNGKSISILGTPWLPDVDDPYVRSRSEAFENQKVTSLMVQDESRWEEDIIHDLFNDRDANLILSIPLNTEVDDNWYWRHEKHGNYTVKTAYHELQKAKGNSQDDNSGFWRALWNLKIPPKVKNILWRAVQNCLPTKDMLRMKQVPVNNICPVCHNAEESVLHVLVSCQFAASCRVSAALPVLAETYDNFGGWLNLLFAQQNKEVITLSAMVCWMLWKNRNDLVWNQRCLAVSEVVRSALSVLDQWQFVQDKHFDPSTSLFLQGEGGTSWQAPESNRVKINTDASLFTHPNRYSHAQVVRDHNGYLIEAMSKCLQGTATPELAEAMGIREALSWVKEREKTNVVVETDCLTIVQWIRSSYCSLSYVGRIVDECRQLLIGLQNQNFMLRFVRRSANSVAHYLASCSSSIADREWGSENIHPDFLSLLCNDLK